MAAHVVVLHMWIEANERTTLVYKYQQPQRTFRKKIGRPCRLFGKDFISISQAARHYTMNYKTVYQLVNDNLFTDGDFAEYQKNNGAFFNDELDLDIDEFVWKGAAQ